MAAKTRKKKVVKPVFSEHVYDFAVSMQLAQFVLADYVTSFVETQQLADFSTLSSIVKDKAFYLSSMAFVKGLTLLFHDNEESKPFTFDETKQKIEQERSLLINRGALAREAKRDLAANPTTHVYQHVLFKALYNSHLFDDQSSKPLQLEELDYDVVEKKYAPLYLFLNFDAVVVDRVSRLFDPDDKTIVSEVLTYLRGTGKYAAYEFYFKACETRLNKKV